MKTLFLIVLLSFACTLPCAHAQIGSANINTAGEVVKTRVNPPEGYFRPPFPAGTYQDYLQSRAMKSADSKVMTFNGFEKKFICYSAVLDVDLMDVDLMHGEHYVQYMRAQYLYNNSKYDMIRFSYDDNRSISYQDWIDGKRFVMIDSTSYVLDSIASPGSTDVAFKKFMSEIYSNTSSLGLNGDTEVLAIGDLSIGDLFIQPADQRTPGHSVLIMDMVVDPLTGERLFLLAQGYTPAQNMHILSNPYEPEISPWYRADPEGHFFTTAQWTFRTKHVRRFRINANANSFWESMQELAEE